MPFLAPLAVPLIGGAISALSNQPKTNTSTGNSTESGTSTTNRNLTPFQTQLQGPVYAQLMQQLQDPSKTVEPFRVAARNRVNANYTGLGDQLRQQFLTTGGGASGKYGRATLQYDLARRGALSDVDQQAQQSAAGNQFSWAQIANQLLGMNFGSTTTGSGTSSGTRTGTESQGSPLTAGLGGFLGTLLQNGLPNFGGGPKLGPGANIGNLPSWDGSGSPSGMTP
jgi:hypothetical protein